MPGRREDPERLPAAAAEVEQRPAAREVRQVDGQALGDLLLGAAETALELDVGELLGRAGEGRPLGRRIACLGVLGAGTGTRLGAFGAVAAPGSARASAPRSEPRSVARLGAVAVQLGVDARVEGVVVPHDLVEALLQDPLDARGAVGERVEPRSDPGQVLEQDQVEDPLAVPEVVLRQLHERTEEPLPAHQQPPEQPAVAAHGEPVVPRPQPLPGREVAGGLAEEGVDAARRGRGRVPRRRPEGAPPRRVRDPLLPHQGLL